jgi:hypothetical protein
MKRFKSNTYKRNMGVNYKKIYIYKKMPIEIQFGKLKSRDHMTELGISEG